jgi:hypothetical protein
MNNTIKLKYPVIIDGVSYKELTMRRSRVKDRLAVANMKDKSDEEKEILLFANLCEVSPDVIRELDESDYPTIQKVYMSFFGSAETSAEKL